MKRIVRQLLGPSTTCHATLQASKPFLRCLIPTHRGGQAPKIVDLLSSGGRAERRSAAAGDRGEKSSGQHDVGVAARRAQRPAIACPLNETWGRSLPLSLAFRRQTSALSHSDNPHVSQTELARRPALLPPSASLALPCARRRPISRDISSTDIPSFHALVARHPLRLRSAALCLMRSRTCAHLVRFELSMHSG